METRPSTEHKTQTTKDQKEVKINTSEPEDKKALRYQFKTLNADEVFRAPPKNQYALKKDKETAIQQFYQKDRVADLKKDPKVFQEQLNQLNAGFEKWAKDNKSESHLWIPESKHHVLNDFLTARFKDFQPDYQENMKVFLEELFLFLQHSESQQDKLDKFQRFCREVRACSTGTYVTLSHLIAEISQIDSLDLWLHEHRINLIEALSATIARESGVHIGNEQHLGAFFKNLSHKENLGVTELDDKKWEHLVRVSPVHIEQFMERLSQSYVSAQKFHVLTIN